jgi:hypothetical protein
MLGKWEQKSTYCSIIDTSRGSPMRQVSLTPPHIGPPASVSAQSDIWNLYLLWWLRLRKDFEHDRDVVCAKAMGDVVGRRRTIRSLERWQLTPRLPGGVAPRELRLG